MTHGNLSSEHKADTFTGTVRAVTSECQWTTPENLSSYSKLLYARNYTALVYTTAKKFSALTEMEMFIYRPRRHLIWNSGRFPTISKTALTYPHHFVLCALGTDNLKIQILTNFEQL